MNVVSYTILVIGGCHCLGRFRDSVVSGCKSLLLALSVRFVSKIKRSCLALSRKVLVTETSESVSASTSPAPLAGVIGPIYWFDGESSVRTGVEFCSVVCPREPC